MYRIADKAVVNEAPGNHPHRDANWDRIANKAQVNEALGANPSRDANWERVSSQSSTANPIPSAVVSQPIQPPAYTEKH